MALRIFFDLRRPRRRNGRVRGLFYPRLKHTYLSLSPVALIRPDTSDELKFLVSMFAEYRTFNSVRGT